MRTSSYGRVTSGPSPLAGYSKLYLVVFALIGAMSLTGATLAAAPQQGGSRIVMAEFDNVSFLVSSTVVRIGGTDVGTANAGTIDPDRQIALIPLELDASAFPLFKDATARVDQLSLIGEKFIELDPGTPEAGELTETDRIGLDQTGLAEDYQEIVQTLDDPTSAGLASLTQTLGQGIVGRGQNVQEIIRQLQPGFGDTAALLTSIERQNGILGQIVEQVQPLTNGLAADQGAVLDRTVDSATNLLGTTAANEQQLQATIAELPATLASAQRTLGILTGTAREAEITLRDLRPTSDQLADISRELQGFTDSADPALEALNPLLDRADELLDEARPLAAELRQTGQPLFDTINRARPVTTALTENIGGPYGEGPDVPCNPAGPQVEPTDVEAACKADRINGLLGFLHNWALTTNEGDALNHYFRVFFVLDDELISGLPGLIPGLPGGPGNPDGAGSGLPGADTITQGEPEAGGSATGLDPTQEQNALGTLMGGR